MKIVRLSVAALAIAVVGCGSEEDPVANTGEEASLLSRRHDDNEKKDNDKKRWDFKKRWDDRTDWSDWRKDKNKDKDKDCENDWKDKGKKDCERTLPWDD